MARKSNGSWMSNTVKKRDKAFARLEFNEKYAGVVAALTDEANAKKRRALELQLKKKLYPLEIAATPAGVVNETLRARALAEFRAKQALPRRAIEQSALRKAKKSGEAAGDRLRRQKLGKLDNSLAAYTAKMLARYPKSGAEASAQAVERYAQAQKDARRQLAEFDAKCEAGKKAKGAAVEKKLALQNEKLQLVFNGANNKLREVNKAVADKLPQDVVLSLKGIKMYFSGIKAVDDLSFDVKQGEVFGLIGPNGAGKTTLFNCITQFYKPTGGDVYYRDRFNNVVNMIDYHAHDVVKTGISRTFQNLEMVLFLSVLDNLLIGAHTYYHAGLLDQFLLRKKLKEEEEVNKALAMEVLARLNLLEYAYLTPQGLPYGVLKKIELARTLMTKPKLIILDEPAAGLNAAETEELAEIICRIRSDFNCTIFLVEHDMNLVMNVCDTVCAISFGKMLAIGPPQEIQENPLVQEAYLGEEGEIVS